MTAPADPRAGDATPGAVLPCPRCAGAAACWCDATVTATLTPTPGALADVLARAAHRLQFASDENAHLAGECRVPAMAGALLRASTENGADAARLRAVEAALRGVRGVRLTLESQGYDDCADAASVHHPADAAELRAIAALLRTLTSTPEPTDG